MLLGKAKIDGVPRISEPVEEADPISLQSLTHPGTGVRTCTVSSYCLVIAVVETPRQTALGSARVCLSEHQVTCR